MSRRAALPSLELCRAQHDWLQGARARLLRAAGIAGRRRVLELGAGWGLAGAELAQRAPGATVVALDLDPAPLRVAPPSVRPVAARAGALPYRRDGFDLVFAQCLFLWLEDPAAAASEVGRILAPGGAIAAIEPDYGGLMESPSEAAVRDLWLAALLRVGADPAIGRRLPALFEAAGLRTTVLFLDRLGPAAPERFDLLAELDLSAEETTALEAARATAAQAVAHLPFWLVLGVREGAL